MKQRADIKDVTFLFPLRVDTVQRIENLQMVIAFINQYFDSHIQILEADKYNNSFLQNLLPKNVKIKFVEDFDPIFYRTHYINQLVNNVRTEIAAVWDSDVLIPKEQILEAVNLIRHKRADFVAPYQGKFLDTSEIVRELYFKTRDINVLKENEMKMKELYAPDPVGGGFFANRKAYLASGLENEFFYGWGREDGERVNRWETLGYKFERVEGYLYHLSHSRGINSQFHSKKQEEIKQAELKRLALMSENELRKEISMWGN